MTARGRPLWFLGVVLGGWTAVRVAVLWPEPMAPRALDVVTQTRPSRAPAIASEPVFIERAHSIMPAIIPAIVAVANEADRSRPIVKQRDSRQRFDPTVPPAASVVAPDAADPKAPSSDAATVEAAAITLGSPLPAARDRSPPTRLHLDTWFVARPGGRDSLSFGQLGGSQAGVRVSYPLEASRRLAVSARLSAPFAGRGAEAAMGLDWRLPIAPVHLLVEARGPLDGGRAGSAVELIAGKAWRLPAGWALESYGQGGVVQRRGGFVDAATTISHSLRRRLAMGAGAWGAAQRGVARIDIGPELSWSVPSRGGFVRLALDYRARITGRARPSSGPALSLGSGF